MYLSVPTLIVFAAVSGLASAQQIVPTSASSTFPGCAVSCAVLLQAQKSCEPPSVAVNSELAYENCFCQSGLVQALYSTPDAICTAECTVESDRTLLQVWFENFCQQVGRGIDPLAATTTTPASTVVVTITSTSSASTSTSAISTGSASSSSSDGEPRGTAWIDTHWRWILMLAILLVGFIGLAWLGIWLKRRHRKKVEERRAASSGFPSASEKRDGARAATPDLWGPHQHMHHTKGWEYQPNEDLVGTGSGRAADRRRLRNTKSSSRKERDQGEVTELASSQSSSQKTGSKGKGREHEESAGLEGNTSTTEAGRSQSQSQSQRRVERDRDGEHQRRLREVRGSRRNKGSENT